MGIDKCRANVGANCADGEQERREDHQQFAHL
jgi:hypothetical protein